MTIMDDMSEMLRLASTITDPLPIKKNEGDRYDMTLVLLDADGRSAVEEHRDVSLTVVRNAIGLLQHDGRSIHTITIARRTKIL
jgi:hypothetical protein